MKKTIIEVEIGEIEVDERYHTIPYKVFVNGKLKDKGEINDDYENGDTPKQWKKRLENGIALDHVISHVFN